MPKVFTSHIFRLDPNWESHKTLFEEYKLKDIQPDIYGRDAELSFPHVHHIHLAQDEKTERRWAKISQVYYRTNLKGSPENDYWLIYAYDDLENNYLLLTIVGPDAHNNRVWRSYLTTIVTDIVNPWIEGRYNDEK